VPLSEEGEGNLHDGSFILSREECFTTVHGNLSTGGGWRGADIAALRGEKILVILLALGKIEFPSTLP